MVFEVPSDLRGSPRLARSGSRYRDREVLSEVVRHPVFVISEYKMLSEALRLIRVYHDLNQSEMARKLKVSKSYLSELEAGKKIPTLPLIETYSIEFGIPVSSIMFFAERIDNGGMPKAREYVSSKIISLLRFIEKRGEIASATKKRKLSS